MFVCPEKGKLHDIFDASDVTGDVTSSIPANAGSPS